MELFMVSWEVLDMFSSRLSTHALIEAARPDPEKILDP